MVRLSPNSLQVKYAKNIQLINQISHQRASNDENPWREEPLPLKEFVEHPDHLSGEAKLSLYPEQLKDLEAFLGTDPRLIFDPDFVPEFNQAFIIYGKGCLGPDEKITDYNTGLTLTVSEWAERSTPILVKSRHKDSPAMTWASPVYHKGVDELFRITLESGKSFTCTEEHRCLGIDDWLRARDFIVDHTEIRTETDYETITAIESIGVGDYYDLTAPYTHCYFDSQGILHHNSGKDTICSFVQCWISHILLCLKSPQQYLGLPPGESIDLPVIGYSEAQAKNVYFAKFKARIKSWAWLKQTIFDLTGITGDKYLKESGDFVHTYHIELPHSINCWSLNSSLGSSEGKNILFWVLDELAAFTSPVKVNLAREIHNLVVSSSRSRFKNRWRGAAISFPRHHRDYMMATADKVARGVITDTYVSIKPTWEVVPHLERSDFDADFARDPEAAATQYGCDPPAAVDSYFRSPELLFLNASGAPRWILEQHLDVDADVISQIEARGNNPVKEVNEWGDIVLDRRGFPKLAAWFRGQKTAAGDPYEYQAHVDVGVTRDGLGLAIGHLHQMPNGTVQPVIDLAIRWTSRMFRDFGEICRPAWFADTKEQIEFIAAAEVDLRTVREFLFFLHVARRFEFSLITFDGYNSAESMQELRKRGLPVALHVVNKKDFDEYKGLVYNRELRYYGAPVLLEESMKLRIVNGTKVEAPRTSEGEGGELDSHKDVVDCVAAVCGRLAKLKDDAQEFYQLPDLSQSEKTVATEPATTIEGMLPIKEALNSLQQGILDDFLS